MLKRLLVIALVATAGCTGLQGDSVVVTQEPPGANCPAGGARIQVGVAEPTFVCRGSQGESSVVTPEPAGANCAAGGVKIQVGADAPSYVCNGSAGANGTSVTVTPEPAGQSCSNGGVRVQAGEAAPAYVCAGATGPGGAGVVATPEPAGANCPAGGVKLAVADGAPTYVCDGAAGSAGAGVTMTAEPAGANCPAGGVAIQVGAGAATYVCDGVAGASATVATEQPGAHCALGGVKVVVGAGIPAYACNGAAGESATVSVEPPGASCADGGVKVAVGAGTPSYVCSGAAGIDGLSATVTVEPSGANCQGGGFAVQVGTGPVSYACNGTDGQGATVTPEDAGAHCAAGGVRVQVGQGAPAYVCNGAAATGPCIGVPALTVTAFTMSPGMPYTATVSTAYPGGIRPLTYAFMGTGGNYVQIGTTDQFTFVPNLSGGPYTHYVAASDGCQIAWGTLSGLYTPPADVTGLALGGPLSPAAVPLAWTDPASANLDHLEVSWAGGGVTVPRASGVQNATVIGGLASGTTYDFTVKALDSRGNRSAGVHLTALTTCHPGYAYDGAGCAEVDNCLTANGGCDGNATCTKTGPATNSCVCHAGYQGDGTSCAEVDACLTANGGCDVNATCAKTGPGTNSCACHAGYQGDGASCAEIDACLTANGGCDVNATCTKTGPATSSCACHAGYQGDGTSCAEIDACLTANGGCDANATCTKTGPGTNSCACSAGYEGSGLSCAGIDACLTANGGCDVNATCTQTGPGTSSCACHAGFDGNGFTCTSAQQHNLQLSFSGSGSVDVSSPGATCSSGACGYSLLEGTVVTLTASPFSGWTFGIWSGCDSVNGLTCTVTMTQDRTISTGFNFNTFTLASSYEGSGGTITSNPAGLNCGSVCSGGFAAGATVRLIAVPSSSDYFVSSWTGCDSFSGATCDVTMDANKSVKAVFSPSPTGWLNACEQAGGTSYFAGGYHDDEFTSVPIGFAYSFYGQSYTAAFVSTNALITFDAGSWEYSNTALVAGSRTMAVFWDDLVTQDPNVTPSSYICTATVGSPGSRQFVVTWNKMGFYGSTDNTALTFSAILHEGSNAVDYVYYDMSSPQGTRGLGASATIGIQGPPGYSQYGFDQSVVTNGLTIHYDAP